MCVNDIRRNDSCKERWGDLLELYGPGEGAEMGESLAELRASHVRAAIRARLARRGIRKDDLERYGVSVAEGDPSIVSFAPHQTAFIRGVLSWR